jgi:hypothetical protein
MRHGFMIEISLSVILLAACNSFQPAPTLTPTPTNTITRSATLTQAPTLSPTPSVTPRPTKSPKPTKTPAPPTLTPNAYGLVLPVGKPVAEWNGIPVMPDAIAGEESAGSYAYTVKNSVAAVQKFYIRELPKIGWTLFASGVGETGNALDMYTKDNEMFSMSIILADEKEGLVLVLLVP